jgi:hypothetical protein
VTAFLCVIAYLLAGVLCLLVLVRTVTDSANDAWEDPATVGFILVISWPISVWFYAHHLLFAYRAKHRSPNA